MRWRHRDRHTGGVGGGTFRLEGVNPRFGYATQSLLDWMVRHAAADTDQVDGSSFEYVTRSGDLCAAGDWLLGEGVPLGWLRLQAGKDVGIVLFDAWADGLMRIQDTELPLLERIALRLQSLTDASIPWGAASAHVLLMLADVTASDREVR